MMIGTKGFLCVTGKRRQAFHDHDLTKPFDAQLPTPFQSRLMPSRVPNEVRGLTGTNRPRRNLTFRRSMQNGSFRLRRYALQRHYYPKTSHHKTLTYLARKSFLPFAAPFLMGGGARGSARGGSAAFIGGLPAPEGGKVRGPGGPGAEVGGPGDAADPTGVIDALRPGGGVAVDVTGCGIDAGAGLGLAGVLRAPGGGGGGAFGASVAPAVLLTQRLSSLS